MILSKARMVIADKGLYLHVNPHTGVEFESEHKVLIFSQYPGDPPMTVARAQKVFAAEETPPKAQAPKKTGRAVTRPGPPKAAEPKADRPASKAPVPAKPAPGRAPKAPQTAMRIRSAHEKVSTRPWAPGAPGPAKK